MNAGDLGEQVQTHSKVVRDLMGEVGKVLVGQEGMGFMMQMMQFQEERLFAAANSLMGMQHVIDETIAYAKDRQVFGMPLIDNQAGSGVSIEAVMSRVDGLREVWTV